MTASPMQAVLTSQEVMTPNTSPVRLSLFLEDGVTPFNPLEALQGVSAFEVAVDNGFEGTEEEWLTSLVGADGADGADGTSFTPAAHQADTTAVDLAALKVDFNALLAKLIAADVMAAS
jgi:hypothetical protein